VLLCFRSLSRSGILFSLAAAVLQSSRSTTNFYTAGTLRVSTFNGKKICVSQNATPLDEPALSGFSWFSCTQPKTRKTHSPILQYYGDFTSHSSRSTPRWFRRARSLLSGGRRLTVSGSSALAKWATVLAAGVCWSKSRRQSEAILPGILISLAARSSLCHQRGLIEERRIRCSPSSGWRCSQLAGQPTYESIERCAC